MKCKQCGCELEEVLAGTIDNGVDNTYVRVYCPCCGKGE